MECLTTGQLIDKLQIGEVAENQYNQKVTYDENGNFVNLQGEFIQLTRKSPFHTDSSKWRILPKYVSFEEAMKALKEGKIVKCFRGPYIFKFTLDLNYKDLYCERQVEGKQGWEKVSDNINGCDILEGKWTIEE